MYVMTSEDRKIDQEKFLAALSDYLPSLKARVKADQGPHRRPANANSEPRRHTSSRSAGGTIRYLPSESPVVGNKKVRAATITSFYFREADPDPELVLEMSTEDGKNFTIYVPWDELADGSDATSSQYDWAHLAASELLGWIDETTFLYTVSELDGKSLADF
jgi:hypothetical protein